MDNRIELCGSAGAIPCDRLHGSAFRTYSKTGYGCAVGEPATTVGWTFTMCEEVWSYGFPQELQHFVDWG